MNHMRKVMEQALIYELPSHQPRPARERRLLRGQMRTERLPAFEIVIRNISSRGLCATCRELPPLRGETAEIQLPDSRSVTAVVRWVNDQAFGIAFDEPIDLEAMVMTLQRLRDIAERNSSWEVKSKHRVADHRPDLTMMRRI